MFSWPDKDEWIFSFKCFIGAMLGLYLCMRIGLPRPYWAPLAAYVASQPFAGSTKAKSLYRICGSAIGGAGIILLIPLFYNYVVLGAIILGLWYGFWIFVALHDRTPRAYAFLLGGYTIGIVAMPGMSSAEQMTFPILFDLAINRVQEIAVGVGAATFIHAVILPTRAGNVVISRLDQALKDTAVNIRNIIDYKRDFTDARPNLNKLSGTITELRIMTTNVPFEAENLRWVHNILGSVQDHLSALVPTLSSIDDRIRYFRNNPQALSPQLKSILDDISIWLEKGSDNPYAYAVTLRRKIDALIPAITESSIWDDMLIANLCNDLYQLVDICEDCFGLRRRVDEGVAGKEPSVESKERRVSTLSLLVDKKKAWASAFASCACVIVTTFIWVISGWNSMFAAPMMGGMYCLFFSAIDNPVPLLKGQFWLTVASAVPAGLYILWLMPSAHSFEMLMLVFFPFFILCGTYLMRPAKAIICIPFFFTTMATMTMFDQGSANMTAFINVQFSQCIGILFSVIFMSICRSISMESLIKGVVKAIWSDIAKLGAAKEAPSAILVAVKMVDGISLIAPRLAIAQKDHEANRSGTLQSAVNILLDMRVGMNMTKLLRAQSRLGIDGSPFQSVLQKLASYYEKQKDVPEEVFHDLLKEIDHAIARMTAMPAYRQQNVAVAALTGIRCDLFPRAQPYSVASVVSTAS